MHNDDLEFLNCSNMMEVIENTLPNPSRAQVAKHLGLSRTATSMIAQKLIEGGLIVELETVKKGRGRPGTPLAVNTNHWHALGAAYLENAWRFVIVNLGGEVVESMDLPVPSTEPEDLIQTLIEGFTMMRDKSPHALIPALGVGAPGLVDHTSGAVLRADDLGWQTEVSFQQILSEKLDFPVLVMNRYRVNGLAEIRFGNHKGSHNIIYLGIGTGISGSIYLDRILMNTTNYRLGHIVIDPNGPLCGCGQRGCLQAMSSEGALLRYAQKRREEDSSFLATIKSEALDGHLITSLAETGNPDAQECLNHIAEPLAIALSTLANAIAPDEVIIGGPLGDRSTYLVDRVRDLVNARLLGWQRLQMSILKGTQGPLGPAVGAATLVLENKMELLFNSGCPSKG